MSGGKKTIVLIHNLIEAVDPETAGYSVSSWVRAGAHRAVSMLRGADLVVFSPTMGELLRSRYGLRAAIVTPIPCTPNRRADPPATDVPTIVTPGYLSPYKGHERIPSVKTLSPSEVRFIVVGGPHRVLMETDAGYRAKHERLSTQLSAAGIEVKGRVSDEELDRLLGEATAALLPYTSTQGASAMFSRIASVGTPVVAPKLPEFEWLESLGAGVLLTPPTVEGLSAGIRQLLRERPLRDELAVRQRLFSKRFSWREFVTQLDRLASS